MEFTSYRRAEAQVRDWEPATREVFEFVRGQVVAQLPDVAVEHIGSSSVPGMPGKGYVDVMVLPVSAAEIGSVSSGLEQLGLQHARGSRPDRPFFLGAVERGARVTNVHLHVIVADSDEARSQHGLAQALRNNPALREQYAAVKHDAVVSGATDPTEYSIRKIQWGSTHWSASASHRFRTPASRPRGSSQRAEREPRRPAAAQAARVVCPAIRPGIRCQVTPVLETVAR